MQPAQLFYRSGLRSPPANLAPAVVLHAKLVELKAQLALLAYFAAQQAMHCRVHCPRALAPHAVTQ